MDLTADALVNTGEEGLTRVQAILGTEIVVGANTFVEVLTTLTPVDQMLSRLAP
jgi:hypothetical protein